MVENRGWEGGTCPMDAQVRANVGVAAVSKRKPVRRRWPDWKSHVAMWILLALVFLPLGEMVIISLKSPYQYQAQPFGVSWPIAWATVVSNFQGGWQAISPYIANSLLYSGASLIGVLLLASFTAFVFARFRFAGKEVLYYAVIALLMVPGVLTLVPQYALVHHLGLLNTRWALILPYWAGGQVFGIFLLRSFLGGIAEEYFEAARIDGAGDWRLYWNIALPLCRPIMATLAILNVIGTWNDLVWPMVALAGKPGLENLTVGLTMFQQEFFTNYGPLMAGYIIASLPLLLLFLVASRQFIEGLGSGSLKI